MSTSLATRFRPASLSQVVGQRHATSVLQAALKRGTLPQQILFSGGSGLGKTTLARCVAAALLCLDPKDGDACRVCQSCLDIADPSRTHPDVIEFDAASNGQKDQIRELAARAQVAPVRSSHRVYIIDEAHGLSRDGGQAFLKLLEEPPAHVVFMLATTDPEKMLKTNRSRCVEFALARPTNDDLAQHLVRTAEAASFTLSPEVAMFLVKNTDDALGVRGLMMSLEKISSMLSWGISPDVSEVAALLGLPPSSKIAELLSAVDSADRLKALSVLDSIRSGVSESMIRHSLRLALRERLLFDPSAINASFYELAVTTPVTPAHTDVLVSRIATPSLIDGDNRVENMIEALRSEVRSLSLKTDRTSESRAATQNTGTDTKSDIKVDTEAVVGRQPEPAKAPRKPDPKTSNHKNPDIKTSDPGLVSVLASLKKALSVKAYAAVQSSRPSLANGRLSLSPPSDPVRSRLLEHREEIKTQAAAIGVSVSVKRAK